MVSPGAFIAPVLVAAVLVFIVSSVLHMVFTYHRRDVRPLPAEAEVSEALRRAAPEPGLYVLPHCASHQDMKNPEMQEKYKRGPVGLITVLPNGLPNMGKYLGLWFAFCLLVGVVTAYLATLTIGPGTPYMQVFTVTGTAAFLAYGVGNVSDSIWKGQPWGNTVRAILDGLIYALVTAGAFGWLWPR